MCPAVREVILASYKLIVMAALPCQNQEDVDMAGCRGIVDKEFLDVRCVRLIVSVYQSSVSGHALKLGRRRF